MENLQILVRWNIYDGNLEAFKNLADKCVKVVMAKDENTFNTIGILMKTKLSAS